METDTELIETIHSKNYANESTNPVLKGRKFDQEKLGKSKLEVICVT